MSCPDQSTRVSPSNNLRDGLLDLLECLPIATCRKRIATFTVRLILLGVPAARANAIDQFRRDAITFNRERVIGITFINAFDKLEISLLVAWQTWACRKRRYYSLSRSLPHDAQASNDRRSTGVDSGEVLFGRKGICFADIVARALHGFDDLIGN